MGRKKFAKKSGAESEQKQQGSQQPQQLQQLQVQQPQVQRPQMPQPEGQPSTSRHMADSRIVEASQPEHPPAKVQVPLAQHVIEDQPQQEAGDKKSRRRRKKGEGQEVKTTSEQEITQQVRKIQIHEHSQQVGSVQHPRVDRDLDFQATPSSSRVWGGAGVQQQPTSDRERGFQQPRRDDQERHLQQPQKAAAQKPESESRHEAVQFKSGTRVEYEEQRDLLRTSRGGGSQQPAGSQDRGLQQLRGSEDRGFLRAEQEITTHEVTSSGRGGGKDSGPQESRRGRGSGTSGRGYQGDQGRGIPGKGDPGRVTPDKGYPDGQGRGTRGRGYQDDRGRRLPGRGYQGDQGRVTPDKGYPDSQGRGTRGRGYQDDQGRGIPGRDYQGGVTPDRGYQQRDDRPSKDHVQPSGKQIQLTTTPIQQKQPDVVVAPVYKAPVSSESTPKSGAGTDSRSQQKPIPQTQQPLKQPSGMQLSVPQRKKLNTAGTKGRRILIETNHLLLGLKNMKRAIHYDVTLVPDTPKKLLRDAVEVFRKTYYPQRYPAFDGKKNLYSASELPIKIPFEAEVGVKEDNREKKFKITIKFAAYVDLSTVNQYFEAVTTNRHLVTPQEAIQCLDIVLRSAPSLNCIPVGRSFFTQPGRILDLGDGMEMYYGFYQSAILGWKPFLNVDVAHKAFPKAGSVLDLIQDICRCDINRPLNPYDTTTIDKFLRTLKVQYEIPNVPGSKRVMRINELAKPARDARFKTDNGQELTVQQYFEVEKNYRLKYPHLPCLWVGSKQREQHILLPMELCTVLPGQVTNKAMTPKQTASMIKYAATSTSVRKEKIMQSVTSARYNDDPCVREFGFSVSHNFTQVEARVLDAPKLHYLNNMPETPRKGVWRAQKFMRGANLDNQWAMLCVDDRTNRSSMDQFIDMLLRSARNLGMQMSNPLAIDKFNLPYRKEKDVLEEKFKKYKDLRLLIVIIPTDNKDIYNYVKQVAELRVATLTQCVKGRNISPPKPSTVDNILLKVNAKLNGVNHGLSIKPKCLMRPCMIMGADVTHPSPESRGTVPSVAAVTASHDPQAFQYNICWRLQPSTQEIIDDLQAIVREHLLFFYKKNKNLKPEQIIFFRDGVSEGQFEIVLNAEIQTIRRACSTLGDGSYNPKITFLVVQKRHHTRFFPMNPRDSDDRNLNVPAGTVVDTEITHPTALDFYLVSHASIQGVARPTKYRMLWDDNDMNEDELEQLTYHLCHMFSRCTRSVSYPAPTYYAHLAAARAKVYCERRQINMNALEREFSQLKIKDEICKDLPMFFV